MGVPAAFARLAGLIVIGDSPVSTSPFHLTCGDRRAKTEMCLTTHSLMWVMGNWTQVLTCARQALYWLHQPQTYSTHLMSTLRGLACVRQAMCVQRVGTLSSGSLCLSGQQQREAASLKCNQHFHSLAVVLDKWLLSSEHCFSSVNLGNHDASTGTCESY